MIQEQLREVLDYNQETGEFTWKVKTGSRAKVGAVAGCPTNGYVIIGVLGETWAAHRLAFLWMTGKVPKEVDHRDRCGLHNWWSNLRPATTLQNHWNRSVGRNCKSKILGVDFKSGRWRAQIRIYGKKTHLGYFDTRKQAANARRAAERRYFGEFAPA